MKEVMAARLAIMDATGSQERIKAPDFCSRSRRGSLSLPDLFESANFRRLNFLPFSSSAESPAGFGKVRRDLLRILSFSEGILEKPTKRPVRTGRITVALPKQTKKEDQKEHRDKSSLSIPVRSKPTGSSHVLIEIGLPIKMGNAGPHEYQSMVLPSKMTGIVKWRRI